MTILFAAATALINPPEASPVLTLDQVWAGLELKRKQPQLFLTVIDTCEVLEDDGETVLREVKFKDGPKKMQEKITHISPITSSTGSGIEVFSAVGTASRVLNIVSTGATPDELYLTFTFEWEHKETEAGSHEAVLKQKEYQAMAPKSVATTLAAMREMAKEGKL